MIVVTLRVLELLTSLSFIQTPRRAAYTRTTEELVRSHPYRRSNIYARACCVSGILVLSIGC